MKKEEAINLIKAFFSNKEFSADDINEQNNFFQIMVDEQIIAFNFREDKLICSSLIYQFQREPKPKILVEIEAEAKIESRAKVKYEAENKTLYVSKEFAEVIDETEFIAELDNLMEISKNWSNEVLDRVASKAFHPKELE
ncbi:MAG: hypothetical protein MUC29_12930 [Pyrinomonadaceae bacterium]|nr:hypothetical protein [Pyrinomonadaceae bacterium]